MHARSSAGVSFETLSHDRWSSASYTWVLYLAFLVSVIAYYTWVSYLALSWPIQCLLLKLRAGRNGSCSIANKESLVQLYVYDLSNGLARQLSPTLLNKQVQLLPAANIKPATALNLFWSPGWRYMAHSHSRWGSRVLLWRRHQSEQTWVYTFWEATQSGGSWVCSSDCS